MNSSENDVEIFPSTGIVSVKTLARMAETNDLAVIKTLTDKKIPILKLGKFRRAWLVRLDDLFKNE